MRSEKESGYWAKHSKFQKCIELGRLERREKAWLTLTNRDRSSESTFFLFTAQTQMVTRLRLECNDEAMV